MQKLKNKNLYHTKTYTDLIKAEANRLGFLATGISKACFLKEDEARIKKWLSNNMHGEMHYMENYPDKRLDPRLLVENSLSVISLLYNYFPPNLQFNPDSFKIARYAYGTDYHQVVKNKIFSLMKFINTHVAKVNGRVFVDSAPVLERAWARKSGLGWIGKNTNLINPRYGSFFFIGELIIDLELEYDPPVKNHCGTCTRCMDACPTGAITEPYVIDARKCISYLTIELKDKIPEKWKGKVSPWIFGCDVCQEACPWNKKAKPHHEPEFMPSTELLNLSKKDWENLSENKFLELFSKSAIKRTKYSGLKRNINFLSSH